MIERCIHEDVCKFKQEGPDEVCGIQEVCKFCTDAEGEPRKRRKAKDDDDGIGSPKIGEKVYKRARKRMEYLRKTGKLDENQLKALEGTKGKHYKSLTQEQVQQIIEMEKAIP
jgi:hypothetical protein